MLRANFFQFLILFIILRCFGMFPYRINKSKEMIRFKQRKCDILLNAILCFSHLCFFSSLLLQCTENIDLLSAGKQINLVLSTVLLYINCYRFVNLITVVIEKLQELDMKIQYTKFNNKLFFLYCVWKIFIYILFISQDVVFTFTCSLYVPFKCFCYMYSQFLIEVNQEALYIFTISLIRDRVVFVYNRIKNVNNANVKTIKDSRRVIMELKENFQLMNTYFAMPLIIKMTNNFAGILLSIGILFDYTKKGIPSISELYLSCGWCAVLCFDVLLFFYCLDRCLISVRLYIL